MKIPKTPELNTESHFIATDYRTAKTDPNAFGAANANALATLAKGSEAIAVGADRIQEQQDYISILDASNKVDDIRNKLLNDQEIGYLHKQGSDAAGKSKDVLNNFDQNVEKIKNAYNLSATANARLDYIIANKRNTFSENVNAHDIQQTALFGKSVCETTMKNNLQNLIANCNNPDALGQFKKDAMSVIGIYQKQANLSQEQVTALTDNYVSQAVSSLINQYQADNNFEKVREFYDKYKTVLSPDVQSQVQATLTAYDTKLWADKKADEIMKISSLDKQYEKINSEKDLMKRASLLSAFERKKSIANKIERENFSNETRTLADNIMKLYPDEQSQLSAAEKIEDTDKRDAVYRRIESANIDKRRLEKQNQDEIQKKFYQTILQKEKSNQQLSLDDIPSGLSAEQELSCRRYVQQKIKSSAVSTDNRVWEYLYKKQVSDAQNFAQLNLEDYKGYISESEYKSFLKTQEDIKKGGYYTDLNNKKINQAIEDTLKSVGANNHFMNWRNLDANKDILKSMIAEYESRRGQKISDDKIKSLASSFGYQAENSKDKTEKKLQSLYSERGVQVIKKLANDITYFESVNARFPNDKEIDDIVNSNIKNYHKEVRNNLNSSLDFVQNRKRVYNEIQNTTAKKNYSKSLTYFEKKVIPQWQNDLGIKITVVNGGTYRGYVKQGSSHHREVGDFSRAIDISTSEHNQKTKYELMRKAVLDPSVQNIGTSDINLLKSFPPSKYPKVVDERNYDAKKGTNHVHHLHLTLINDSVPNQLVIKK